MNQSPLTPPVARGISPILLYSVAFFSGAVVMIVELVASRIMAPYLGASVITWTSIIGVILLSLSVGYWYGGRRADRGASGAALATILAGAALSTALIVHTKPLLVLLTSAPLPLAIASTAGAFFLFFAPAALLGMVSPIIAKLVLRNLATTGATVGMLYALSTVGSIIGTFLGGFVLISFLGTANILYALSGLLLLLSLLVALQERDVFRSMRFPLLFVLTVGSLAMRTAELPFLAADVDTRYGRVLIYDSTDARSGRETRIMTDNILVRQSGQYRDAPEELLFDYLKRFDLAAQLVPRLRTALLIGGGMFTYPTHFARAFPEATLHVVEIDPALPRIAKQYFSFAPSANIRISAEDGRGFLNRNSNRYDAVFVDAYNSFSNIPFELTTKEAVQRMHAALRDDGVLIANILGAGAGRGSALLRAMHETYASVFPEVRVLQVQKRPLAERQNFILVARKKDGAPRLAGAAQGALSGPARDHWERVWKPERDGSTLALTDDFAPVERYMSYLAR
jgi:MFS family permease